MAGFLPYAPSVLIFLICYFLVVFLVILAHIFVKRFLVISFYSVAIVIFIASPFIIKELSNKFFYKIEILDNKTRVLEFSNATMANFIIKNEGWLNISQCQIDIYQKIKDASIFQKTKNLLEIREKKTLIVKQRIPRYTKKHIYRIFTNHSFKKNVPLEIRASCI